MACPHGGPPRLGCNWKRETHVRSGRPLLPALPAAQDTVNGSKNGKNQQLPLVKIRRPDPWRPGSAEHRNPPGLLGYCLPALPTGLAGCPTGRHSMARPGPSGLDLCKFPSVLCFPWCPADPQPKTRGSRGNPSRWAHLLQPLRLLSHSEQGPESPPGPTLSCQLQPSSQLPPGHQADPHWPQH